MTTIDIRTQIDTPITNIRIADVSSNFYIADLLTQCAGGASLMDSCSGRDVRIISKEHANNLRKALDKAEQLGWLK